MVFSREQPRQARYIGKISTPSVGARTVEFTDLPPDTCAVIVFHDENGNGMLKNGLGMRTEAYAISNNARGMSAPDFKDAAIVLGQGHREIEISFIYPLHPSKCP